MKKKFYMEAAYFVGLLILALGTALMEKADFGMSMVVAPAYLVHLKVSAYLPWFSFGVAEYTFQALLLVVLILSLRQFRISYLFSFVTAFLYGNILDLNMKLVSYLNGEAVLLRLLFFVIGMILCAIGVAFLFHTYIAPEVYELFVKELVTKYGWKTGVCKTIYDCISCLVAVAMSFVFFGLFHFEGVKAGTFVCALINGFLIGSFSKLFEKKWDFVKGFQNISFFSKNNH